MWNTVPLRSIYPLSGAVSVSTLTTLLAFTNLSRYGTLLFVIINQDAVNAVQLVLDTSEDGIAIDSDKRQIIQADALTQASLEVGPGQTRTYWRLSAQSISPFPTVAVKWRIAGLGRGVINMP